MFDENGVWLLTPKAKEALLRAATDLAGLTDEERADVQWGCYMFNTGKIDRAALEALPVVDEGPPPMTPELRALLEAYQPSYTRLSAEGRAAFDAYDGPVCCGAPGPMRVP